MSRLKISGNGDAELRSSMTRLAEKLPKEATAIMDMGAEKLHEKARSNAPVDSMSLETAITLEKKTGIRIAGRFAPAIYDIFVNEDLLSDRADGFPYHLYWENNPIPNLGPKSQEKASRGHDVGGRYMARAFEEVGPEIERDLEELARSIDL